MRVVPFCGIAGILAGITAAEPPTLTVPRAAEAPGIDGRLDETAWTQAAVIPSLLPPRGQQASADIQPTEIRLLWDATGMHLAFRCLDDEIYASGTIPHDGDVYREDVCEVFLDAKGDGRQWIEIQVNPLNQTLDLMSLNVGDTASLPNGRLASTTDLFSFRGWEAEGLRTAAGRLTEGDREIGWTVEMTIPATALTKRLGVKELQPGAMRANFIRYDHRLPQSGTQRRLVQQNWAPVVHGCPHISPSAMGFLILAEEPVPRP